MSRRVLALVLACFDPQWPDLIFEVAQFEF
jgi:hypothetical protein